MLVNLYVVSLVLAAALLVVALFVPTRAPSMEEPRPGDEDTTRPSQLGQLDGVGRRGFASRCIRSGRFWTFFVAFFGMTGLILDGLDLSQPAVAFLVAVASGSIVGAGAFAALRIGAG